MKRAVRRMNHAICVERAFPAVERTAPSTMTLPSLYPVEYYDTLIEEGPVAGAQA
jgi:hypothetical protein